MNLLVTRPQPAAETLATRLRAAGHMVLCAPLLETEYLDAPLDGLDTAQAVVATSANALVALAGRNRNDALERARRLPIYAVGEATAERARRLGFDRIVTGPGTAAELCATIAGALNPEAGGILLLRGEAIAYDVASHLRREGFSVSAAILYRMREATTFGAAVAEALQSGWVQGVVLLSPRTARVYSALLCQQAIVDCAGAVRHYCLSAAVARALEPLGPVRTLFPDRPNTEELLALLSEKSDDC